SRVENRLRIAVARLQATHRDSLIAIERRLERSSPRARLRQAVDRVSVIAAAMERSAPRRLHDAKEKLVATEKLLGAVGYKSVLARGYSITRLLPAGQLVRFAAKLNTKDRIVTQLADGQIESVVVDIPKPERPAS